MFIKTSFITFSIMVFCFGSFGQSFDINEKVPVVENGFEYGYTINSEQIKIAKGEECSRYEITLYLSNKSNCSKIYTDKKTSFSFESPNLLATFDCRNANGKRLTSKSGIVKAREFYINLKKTTNGKEIIESVKAGYIFRNGETVKDNIIVLVPKGERPPIQCTPNILTEMQ